MYLFFWLICNSNVRFNVDEFGSFLGGWIGGKRFFGFL